jgi:phosphoadenosine phosphosulfate reductase
MNKDIKKFNLQFKNASPQEVISFSLNKFKHKIAFASSFGLEDQVIIDMIASIDKYAEIFTLDTGRLFPETYNLISETQKRYNIKIKIFFPDNEHVEKMVIEKGINLFYDNVENRRLCCNIRKVRQLERALKGLDAWICGIRKEQSVSREDSQMFEWDDNNNLININPLVNWTWTQVWEYIKKHNVPYNPLHDKGYMSIGCQPCTRPVKQGEDIRSGRWWWEYYEHKECGLHSNE